MKIIARTLTFLLFTLPAWALDFTPQGIYRATKEACSQVSEADLDGTAYDQLAAGQFPSKEFTDLIQTIKSNSFRKAIAGQELSERNFFATHLISSPEFRTALRECYREDSPTFEFFLQSIRRADLSGKTAGGGLLTLSMTLGPGAFARVVSYFTKFPYKSLLVWTDLSIFATLLTSDSEKREPTPKKDMGSSDLSAVLEPFKGKSGADADAAIKFLARASERQIQKLQGQLAIEENPQKRAQIERSIQILQESAADLKNQIDVR